jgi:chromosome segregation ATPase
MRLRLEQRKHLADRLRHMLIAPRPDLLATAQEQQLLARLDGLEEALGSPRDSNEALRLRIRHLRGRLTWQIETEYHERLTLVHEHLRELEHDVDELNARYDAFVRTRQAATHSYVGYETRIGPLRERVSAAVERLEALMTRQGHVLETVAIAELTDRRARLETYQHQARFAFADSYDRAAKAQVE